MMDNNNNVCLRVRARGVRRKNRKENNDKCFVIGRRRGEQVEEIAANSYYTRAQIGYRNSDEQLKCCSVIIAYNLTYVHESTTTASKKEKKKSKCGTRCIHRHTDRPQRIK